MTVYATDDQSGIFKDYPGYVTLYLDDESIEKYEAEGKTVVPWKDADLVLQEDGSLVATFFVTDSWLEGEYYLQQVHVRDTEFNDAGTMWSWEDTPIPNAVYTLGQEEVIPEDSESSITPEPSETVKPSENPAPSGTVKPSEEPTPSVSPTPTKEYKDVPATGKWYSEAVAYVTEQGYMTGISVDEFGPDGTVTRAMIAQMLYAAEDKPKVDGTSVFSDVEDGKWYTDAVEWAAEEEIVSGYGDGTYGPNKAITREQMVAIMYKYAKSKGYDTADNGNLSKFKDQNKVSGWAVTAMKWAVGHNIISGTDIGIEPQTGATRAQVAVILQAFDKNVRK